MNNSPDISKSEIREIIKLNFFNDLDDLDTPNTNKVKIEEDKDIVKLESSEEVKDIKVEDFQESQLNEIVPGSLDLIEIVKHEINSDDQDCTSIRNEDIDTKHDDEILDSDPSSLCEGFTDEERAEAKCRLESLQKIDAIFLPTYDEDICDPSTSCEGFTDEEKAEAECKLESFKKIDAIFLANYMQDMSVYACGTPTGTYNFLPFSASSFAAYNKRVHPSQIYNHNVTEICNFIFFLVSKMKFR